ncbi:hypothetical protein J6590_022293 [Homalodisca vitripennis]|nr:hypothetical protein J6590_022293 [Homalodisca vitripennis]
MPAASSPEEVRALGRSCVADNSSVRFCHSYDIVCLSQDAHYVQVCSLITVPVLSLCLLLMAGYTSRGFSFRLPYRVLVTAAAAGRVRPISRQVIAARVSFINECAATSIPRDQLMTGLVWPGIEPETCDTGTARRDRQKCIAAVATVWSLSPLFILPLVSGCEPSGMYSETTVPHFSSFHIINVYLIFIRVEARLCSFLFRGGGQ